MMQRWFILLELIFAITCLCWAEELGEEAFDVKNNQSSLCFETNSIKTTPTSSIVEPGNFTDDPNFVSLPWIVMITKTVGIVGNISTTECTGALVDNNIVIVPALYVEGYERMPKIFSVIARKSKLVDSQENIVITRTVIEIELDNVRQLDNRSDFAALFLSEPITDLSHVRLHKENETITTSKCLVSSFAKNKIIPATEKKLQTLNWEYYYEVENFERCQDIMELRMKLNQRNGCCLNWYQNLDSNFVVSGCIQIVNGLNLGKRETSLLFCPVRNSAHYALVGTVTWSVYPKIHDIGTLISLRPVPDWIIDQIASLHWYTAISRWTETLIG